MYPSYVQALHDNCRINLLGLPVSKKMTQYIFILTWLFWCFGLYITLFEIPLYSVKNATISQGWFTSVVFNQIQSIEQIYENRLDGFAPGSAINVYIKQALSFHILAFFICLPIYTLICNQEFIFKNEKKVSVEGTMLASWCGIVFLIYSVFIIPTYDANTSVSFRFFETRIGYLLLYSFSMTLLVSLLAMQVSSLIKLVKFYTKTKLVKK